MFGWILRVIIKPLLPHIMDYGIKLFKWDKTLEYVEKDNELDVQMRDIEQKCTDIGFKVSAMQTVLKDLGEDSHPQQDFDDRIIRLEEFEKQVRRKKAFKRKDAK